MKHYLVPTFMPFTIVEDGVVLKADVEEGSWKATDPNLFPLILRLPSFPSKALSLPMVVD